MGFFTGLLTQKPDHECRGVRTYLRAPLLDDFEQWRDLRRDSRSFLEPWEPAWNDDEFLMSAFRRRIVQYARMAHEDRAYPFFIFDVTGEKLLGAITLSNIRRGVAETATLGYWTGEKHARHGVMTDALQAITSFADAELGLHRVEAACLPHNVASMHLLERAQFVREGFARGYIKINGQWEDHVLWGKVLGETVAV
jgi:[ribosomal protein S5]-alanine N-acetyltransferase